MLATHTRLIKFSGPGPTTKPDFDEFEAEQKQSRPDGDEVGDVVWTTGDFDVVITIKAKGATPAPLVTSFAEGGVQRTVDLAHRPL